MTPFQTSFPHALEVRDEIAVGDVVLRLKGTHCGCPGCPCNESERYEGVLVNTCECTKMAPKIKQGPKIQIVRKWSLYLMLSQNKFSLVTVVVQLIHDLFQGVDLARQRLWPLFFNFQFSLFL